MPTITIKNGNRTLKLTKRELQTLADARGICISLAGDYVPLKESADSVVNSLGLLLHKYNAPTPPNGKPAAKQPE